MKTVIVTIPMRRSEEINLVQYPMAGNKAMEYEGQVRYPINAILAKTLKKDEQVKIILILTTGENSLCEQNKKMFIEELEKINKNIEAKLSYDTVEIDFEPTKQTYNKLITDLAEKIPENAELYTDITYGFKPEILSLFCGLRFVEEFRDAIVEFIVYGKVEFNKETREPEKQNIENVMLYDITSLYYLFKLMGSMGADNADDALATLKEFFAM